MRKIYKMLFALILLFIIKGKSSALTYGGCDYATVANLKSLINNINLSYTYQIKDNEAYFNITLNNIPNNIYFLDSRTQKRYTYSDANDGEITINGYKNIKDGQFKFYVNNNVCNGVKLGTKYYSFPIYNVRYKSDECKDIPNYALCKKWVSKYYSDYEFEKKISEYKESFNNNDKIGKIEYKKDLLTEIVEFYVEYYYYFLPTIIAICLIIMFISRRKNKFKL